MAHSAQPYVQEVARALTRALCIQAFPSTRVDCHSAPVVETRTSPELLLDPVLISRSNKSECCLIEPSINSVRVSLLFHMADALEAELTSMFTKFIMQRAEALHCVRKVALPGYHLTFLITDAHLVTLGRKAILDLMLGLIQQFDADVSELRLAISARGRAVATQLLKSLAF